VSDKTAVSQVSTSQVRATQRSGALQPADQSSTPGPSQALIASTTPARVAARHSGGNGELESEEQPLSERDTEPSIDAQILRDALRRGLSK